MDSTLVNYLITAFTELRDYNKDLKMMYKVAAYDSAIRKLIELLQQHSNSKGNVSMESIKNSMGASLYKKAEELIQTGKIQEYLNLKNVKDFARIKAIGPAMIKKLQKLNITSISELKQLSNYNKNNKNPIVCLSYVQLLGLRYFNDLNKSIPRLDVKRTADELLKFLDIKKYTIAGSYRRGKQESGDVDILLIDQNLKDIKNKLMDYRRLVGIISAGSKKLSCILKDHNRVARQVDIRSFGILEYPAALMHFTGSKQFNTHIRGIAKSQGFTLNEYGLYKCTTQSTCKVQSNIHSEADIFNALKLEYVPPKSRNE